MELNTFLMFIEIICGGGIVLVRFLGREFFYVLGIRRRLAVCGWFYLDVRVVEYVEGGGVFLGV